MKRNAIQPVFVFVEDAAGDPLQGAAAQLSCSYAYDTGQTAAGTGDFTEVDADDPNLAGLYLYTPQVPENDADSVFYGFTCSIGGTKVSRKYAEPGQSTIIEGQRVFSVQAFPAPTADAFGTGLDEMWAGAYVRFMTGPLAGIVRKVDAITVSGVVSVDETLPETPAAGTQAEFIGRWA